MNFRHLGFIHFTKEQNYMLQHMVHLAICKEICIGKIKFLAKKCFDIKKIYDFSVFWEFYFNLLASKWHWHYYDVA